MLRTILLGILFLAPLPGSCALLYNNAAIAGLAKEGLRTRSRTGGGDYSEVQLGNASAATSFRQWTFRVADDFVVDGAGWKVTKVSVFGYQPFIHFPSLDEGVMEIRQESFAGPVLAQGFVTDSAMTDIYRIFFNLPQDDYQVQRITYSIRASLPPGRYWLTFSAFGIGNQDGPWGPYLTKAGALTVPGANAMVRLSGPYIGWEPIVDPGSHLPQDLPFYIDGHRLGLIGPVQ